MPQPDGPSAPVIVPLHVRDRLAAIAARRMQETGRAPAYGEVIESLLDAAEPGGG